MSTINYLFLCVTRIDTENQIIAPLLRQSALNDILIPPGGIL